MVTTTPQTINQGAMGKYQDFLSIGSNVIDLTVVTILYNYIFLLASSIFKDVVEKIINECSIFFVSC